MEKIVYVLGAGFSAPLGLPVMSNFLEKSKDLYFGDPAKFDYFKIVFKRLQDLSIIKNYMRTDLLNIEEILSILEMESFAKGRKFLSKYKNYLKDVISNYTPPIIPYKNDVNKLPRNWEGFCFGEIENRIHNFYGHFISRLFQLIIKRYPKNLRGIPQYEFHSTFLNQKIEYSLITVNYDMVLENSIEYINKYFPNENGRYNFVFDYDSLNKINKTKEKYFIKYAKLHGTLEPLNIVAPTWNKTNSKILSNVWRLAYEMIKNATQIRIIGYSLPVTDTYIKYLLMIGIKETQNMKNIDVMCLDKDGSVKGRYENVFGDFPKFRFKNDDVTNYLRLIFDEAKIKEEKGSPHDNPRFLLKFNKLEHLHHNYMGR